MRQTLPLLVLLAAVAPAHAEDRPLFRPTRDVMVEYRSSGMPQGPSGAPGGITMRFTSKGHRVRINSPSGRGYALLDIDAERMTMVLAEKQMYIEQPAGPGMMAMFEAKGTIFRKTGTDTVAGYSCTTYDATANDHDHQVCLTDDGVLLRARGSDQERDRELVAVKVVYEDQPAALFETPAGFKKLDIPNMTGQHPVPGDLAPRPGMPPVPNGTGR